MLHGPSLHTLLLQTNVCIYIHANKHLCLFSLQNKLGDTPLHNAAWKGHADVVAALLERG